MNIFENNLHIEHENAPPYYLQLEKQLREMIESEKIKLNEQLPPENQIAAICNVSRVTVRQALKKLEEAALVYRVAGKGTFVGTGASSGSESANMAKTIVVFLGTNNARSHPYTMQFIEGVERQANLFGFSVLICSDLRKILTGLPVAGIILTERIELQYLKKLQKKGIPFILTNEHEETYQQIFPSVCLDNQRSGYKQTKYLLDLGHKRIAIFTGILDGKLKGEGNRKRLAGYREALKEQGIAFDSSLVKQCDYNKEKIITMTNRMIKSANPPTAIIAADDIGAGIIINTLRTHHIRIPDDVSIVGMGNFELIAVIQPALTTLHIAVTEFGERAFSLLYQIINHEKNDFPVYVHGDLVIRDSCSSLNYS